MCTYEKLVCSTSFMLFEYCAVQINKHTSIPKYLGRMNHRILNQGYYNK